ncbi:MAG: ATP-binding protein, partial [Chlorobium sp.]|nr:ATP-binding protein [Chlorobium sp.]
MPVYDLKLASSFDECGKLRDYLAVMADREGFSQAFFEELELVVKEAFVNAVRHGNG